MGKKRDMQLTVSGKQVDLSDALRVHVSEHLDNITNKYFDHALEANITFSKARSFFTCDINLHAGRGVTVRGEGEAADARAAFDDAAEHIAKRLRRYRQRVNEHARGAGARAKPEPGRQYILRDDGHQAEPGTEPASTQANGHDSQPKPQEEHEDSLHATIIAEADTVIETLSVRDAVMHMDLAYQQLLMFRNCKNGQLNVVYRRPDGHIGWIDPTV
jgi:ribosomal subunit interface protein